jgi:S1-C subfamily serine protease
LLNAQGQVEGINTLRFDQQSDCPSSTELDFAIPSDTAEAALGTLIRVLPGARAGLAEVLGSYSEIRALSITTRPVSLPYLHFGLPISWHVANGHDTFTSSDGLVSISVAARRYAALPSTAQLHLDALRLLTTSAAFQAMGTGPITVNTLSGVVVSVLSSGHRYRSDAMALVDTTHHIELTMLRLVDPAASLRDKQEADALLQGLVPQS